MNPFTRYMKDSNEPQEQSSQAAASTAPTSQQQSRSEAVDESSARPAGGRNILSADVEIKGKINFTNDLVVDGKIEGEILSDGSLTVGENARIRAEIRTRSVVIYGKVYGNITVTERVELKKDAELIGDIKAGTISIEAGAIFVGNSTVGTPTEKPAPIAAAKPVARPNPATSTIPAPKEKQEVKHEEKELKIDPAMAAIASRSMPTKKSKRPSGTPVSASPAKGTSMSQPLSSKSAPASAPKISK